MFYFFEHVYAYKGKYMITSDFILFDFLFFSFEKMIILVYFVYQTMFKQIWFLMIKNFNFIKFY